jgi:hypothetical protein
MQSPTSWAKELSELQASQEPDDGERTIRAEQKFVLALLFLGFLTFAALTLGDLLVTLVECG